MNCQEIINELEHVQDRYRVLENSERASGNLASQAALIYCGFAFDELIKLFKSVQEQMAMGNTSYAKQMLRQHLETTEYCKLHSQKIIYSYGTMQSPQEMMMEMLHLVKMTCKKKFLTLFESVLDV